MIKNDHNFLIGFNRTPRALARWFAIFAVAAIVFAVAAPALEVQLRWPTARAEGVGSDPGGSTGSDPGGSTGSDPGGSTGSDPGGSVGSAPGGPGDGVRGGDPEPFVPPAATRTLALSKQVRNLTRGETSFMASTNAVPGETVQFRITARSTGNAAVAGITFRDIFPSQYLDFNPGSAFLTGPQGRINIDQLLPVISNATMAAGETDTLEFNATVKAAGISGPFGIGATTVTNTATLEAAGVPTVGSSATVVVTATPQPAPPAPAPPPQLRAALTISKQARNITRGELALREQVEAFPGETVLFSIRIESTGNEPARQVLVRDILPNGFTYETNSTQLDFQFLPGDITSGPRNLGDLTPGAVRTLQFHARVTPGAFGVGTTPTTNTATVQAENVAQIQDTAQVNVALGAPSPGPAQLTISNQVRNLTRNETVLQETTNAAPGDEVLFMIEIRSIGQSAARNVLVRDLLPDGFDYTFGSTRIDIGFSGPDGITSGFLTLGDLTPGQTKRVHFLARVRQGFFAAGTSTRTNTALSQADNAPQVQDTAAVNVTVAAAGIPLITISKLGRNLTRNDAVLQETTNASPGEVVLWSIKVDSVGGATARNVTLRDNLPFQMTYQAGTSQLAGNPIADGVTSGGINVGDIPFGQNRILTFQAIVAAQQNFSQGVTTLINTGAARADGIFFEVQDTATLAVNVPPTPPPGQGQVTLTKAARNVSRGETAFAAVTNANPGEIVEFSLRVNSVGTAAANNVLVQDFIPFGLTFSSGSVRLDGVAQPDTITAGLALGTLAPGQSRTVTFQATVRDAASFPAGVTSLTNTANVSGTGSGFFTVQATAQVLVSVAAPPAVNPNLAIAKTLRNVTRGETALVRSTNADPNQEIEMSIRVDSNGVSPAQNVTVTDFLDRMTYVAGSTRIDGAVAADGITAGGLSLGAIPNGAARTVTFRATVRDASAFPVGTSVLTDTATASAANVALRQDTATVIVTVGTTPTGTTSLAVFKQVRNLTRADPLTKTTTADPTQELEFSVRIDSNGTATAQNARLTDVLPFRLTYVAGSTRVDGVAVADGVASGGLSIGTIPNGQTRTVTYRARVADRSQFPVGQTVLNNFATATADTTFARQDTASVLVTISQGALGNPIINLTKRVANTSRPNGTDFLNEGRPNDQLTYTIELRNTGTADLVNAVIEDTLPPNTSFVSASGNGFLSSANMVRWFVGTVSAGGQTSVTYTVRINAGLTEGTFITNAAQARADNHNQVSSNEVTTVIRLGQASATLQKTVDRLQARRGETLGYTITFVNTSGAEVRNVVFTDTLALRTTLVSNSSGASVSGRELTWRLASVGANSSAAMTATVRINADAPNGTVLVNAVTLTADNLSTQTAQAQTTVIPEEVFVAKAGPIPPTGADTWVSAVLLSFIASVGVTALLYRRFVQPPAQTLPNN